MNGLNASRPGPHSARCGVALGRHDVRVRTATGFKTKTAARAWVAQDAELECAADPLWEYDPTKSPGH
jgi:hypothetical protein